jgi:hypothetical protein
VTGARDVQPELLDELPPDDPRARRSRADLRRIHVAMRTGAVLAGAVARATAAPPRRIVELGAGDGTVLLSLARRRAATWRDVELTLVDRVDVVDARTRAAYARLGWRMRVERRCALEWARDAGAGAPYDLGVATLFLHHFPAPALAELLRGVAARTRAFVAVEPRRDALAALGSRLVALLGANAVTRADAVASVAAGFRDAELAAAWPAGDGRARDERPARPFAHLFTVSAESPGAH